MPEAVQLRVKSEVHQRLAALCRSPDSRRYHLDLAKEYLELAEIEESVAQVQEQKARR